MVPPVPEGSARGSVELLGVNLFAALRHNPEDELPVQPTDDDLLAWAEELRSSYEPRRRRPLVAAPVE